MAPVMDMVDGTFVSKKDQKYIDWITKSGCPADMAKHLLNSTWTMVLKQKPNGIQCDVTSPECPEFNDSRLFVVGAPQDVDCPLFGGKAKVFFKATGDNAFEGQADTVAFGKFKWTEKYTPAGLTTEYIMEGGSSYKEFWERHASFEGWYAFDRSEKVDEYISASGQDAAMKDLMQQAKFCYKARNGGYDVMETFGQYSVKHFFKFGEEFEYNFPEFPEMAGKCVATKANESSINFVVKKSNGNEEHWNLQFFPNGALYTSFDKKSGASAKAYFKKCPNYFGKFRLVAEVGLKEFTMGMGAPEAAARAVCQEDVAVEFRDKGDGYIQYLVHSKMMPQDLVLRMEEEFELNFAPLLPVTFKGCGAVLDNKVVTVFKAPMGTMKCKMTFGDTFAVTEAVVIETGLKYVTISERV